jgi:hypothetical protein
LVPAIPAASLGDEEGEAAVDVDIALNFDA